MVNYIPRSNFAYKLQHFEGCFMQEKGKKGTESFGIKFG